MSAGFPKQVRQFQYVTPPRQLSATGVGQEMAVTVSSTAQVVNLQLLFDQAYNAGFAQTSQQQAQNIGGPSGVTGNYITIYADGADLGIIVGVSLAAVTSPNSPALATVGTLSGSGTYQGATGACHRIPSGAERRYLVQAGYDNFLAVVGSVTGTMRLYQSSPPMP